MLPISYSSPLYQRRDRDSTKSPKNSTIEHLYNKARKLVMALEKRPLTDFFLNVDLQATICTALDKQLSA